MWICACTYGRAISCECLCVMARTVRAYAVDPSRPVLWPRLNSNAMLAALGSHPSAARTFLPRQNYCPLLLSSFAQPNPHSFSIKFKKITHQLIHRSFFIQSIIKICINISYHLGFFHISRQLAGQNFVIPSRGKAECRPDGGAAPRTSAKIAWKGTRGWSSPLSKHAQSPTSLGSPVLPSRPAGFVTANSIGDTRAILEVSVISTAWSERRKRSNHGNPRCYRTQGNWYRLILRLISLFIDWKLIRIYCSECIIMSKKEGKIAGPLRVSY